MQPNLKMSLAIHDLNSFLFVLLCNMHAFFIIRKFAAIGEGVKEIMCGISTGDATLQSQW